MPDAASSQSLSAGNVCQLPLYRATDHNNRLAKVMRQRVKAKAPKWVEAVADIRLPTAQQAAANRARYSYGKKAVTGNDVGGIIRQSPAAEEIILF